MRLRFWRHSTGQLTPVTPQMIDDIFRASGYLEAVAEQIYRPNRLFVRWTTPWELPDRNPFPHIRLFSWLPDA